MLSGTATSDLQARLAWWTKRGAGAVFDALHGIDTSVGLAAEELEITSANRNKGIAYDTCPRSTLRRSMRLASLRAEGFTFVDMGCGKGKVLLSAMALPFGRIVGVEYSAYFCRVAEKNVTSARFLRRRCSSIEIICSDAGQYQLPDEPIIIFFNNPFIYEIMQLVLDNIVASYINAPRPIYLVFYRASSMMPQIHEFLPRKSSGRARHLISATLGSRTINIFELPGGQRKH